MQKRNYLIYGFNKSGKGAFNLIYNKRDNFYIYDKDKTLSQRAYEISSKYSNVFALTLLDKDIIDLCNILILSPGISIFDELVEYAKSKNKIILNEQEIAFKFAKPKIIAITGTNGKTTTVRLVTDILNLANKKAISVGNIGYCMSSAIYDKAKCKFFICETSSFQLEILDKFKPKIACILNITQDHIARHKTFENYKKAKYNIFKNLTKKEYLICNNNLSNEIDSKKLKCNNLFFGRDIKDKDGCFVLDDKIVFKKNNKIEYVCSLFEINFLGNHNLENIMAAIAICKLLKVKNDIIVKAINNFKLDNHRIQKIFEMDGIEFYDDSKATNLDATIKAVEVFKDRQINLILGGSDKGYQFNDLFKSLNDNVVNIFGCGEVKEKLLESAQLNKKDIKIFETLKQATTNVCKIAKKGEIVLLSPANASFDEFSGYDDRGKKFLEYIKEYYKNKIENNE